MHASPNLERTTSPASPPRRRRLAAWPLWAVVAGATGAVATFGTDLRPAAEQAAFDQGVEYVVTPADMMGLDPLLGRLGFVAGLIALAALIVFAAAWRRHVESRFSGSTAARVFSIGLVATAGALTLGYGWRGALANYLGPESGMYDSEGLFVYFMLTDFGAYLPWAAVVVSAFALAWMAWVERSVSRVLGTVTALFAVGTLGLVALTGVPGLPGVFMPAWLVIVGLWLAVGRSRVTEPVR